MGSAALDAIVLYGRTDFSTERILTSREVETLFVWVRQIVYDMDAFTADNMG